MIMTPEEILKGNRLIAEFMDLDVLYGDYVLHESAEKGKATKMKYHSSWDWLMPVVDKIESLTDGTKTCLYWFEITPSFVLLYSHPQLEKIPDFEIKVENNNKLEAVWNGVVRFIEWYNQQNK